MTQIIKNSFNFNRQPGMLGEFSSQPERVLGNLILNLMQKVMQSNGQMQSSLVRFLDWATIPTTSSQEKTNLFLLADGRGSEFIKHSSNHLQQRVSLSKTLFPMQAVAILLSALEAIETTDQVSELHSHFDTHMSQLKQAYLKEVVDKHRQTEEGLSFASVFLLNQVGLKTIQLVLPPYRPGLRGLIRRFYLDDQHPMDLQKLFRDSVKSVQVGCVMKNLMKIGEKSDLLTRHFTWLSLPGFNKFLHTFVTTALGSMTLEQRQGNLLGVQTVELNTEPLRQKQRNYYSSLGISKEEIETYLQFSTPSQRNGIYLYPKGETRDREFVQTEQEVFLKVLDADSRTVVISSEGFQILEKLQLKMTQNLFQLMQKLKTAFPEHMITGRVKSARSFLDKCGRLCEKTQKEATDKCRSTLDIVDVCGCRITCSSSAQIFAVIETLTKLGFEFLELDNKYNTIRKDGAYKVIPCTLKDPKTGLIFELQITTLTSTIVSDLFHNVIYKQHTIGLNPTSEELEMVLGMQRWGALTETVSLVSKNPIILTETLKGEAILEALDLLRNMVETVRQQQPAKL